MAGFTDILQSFVGAQDAALRNQMDLYRIEEQQRQNALAQQNFEKQMAFDRQKFDASNAYNQGILQTQRNADRRAQSAFDFENAERALQQNLNFAIQSLDFTKDNWTPEDALDPSKEAAWRALNNIPEVRELLGGEIRLAVVPGSEASEGGPIYSFQVFNDKTGTTGPLTTLRGNQRDEYVVFHDRKGVITELNNIKELVRSRLGVDPRYVTDASVALMQQGADAEAAATQAIPEIKPFGSAALNADRMGTTASTQSDIQGLGPVGTGDGYSGTVAEGNRVANSVPTSTNATAPTASANNGALGTTRVATNPNPANSAQGAAINQRLQAVSQTIAQLEADYANARGQNPVQATQIYQQLQAAYNEQQQLADEYAQIGGPLTSSSQTPNQSAQPTQFNQQTTGALGAPRIVTQPTAAAATTAATATAATASTALQASNPAAPTAPVTQLGEVGVAPPMGYGSEERIARSAATLAQPFLDQANAARQTFNAASSYRGIVPTAQQLEAVNFSRGRKSITDAQASNLLSDGDMTGARTTRAGQRMTESRAIMTNATDNARQVVTNIQDNNKDVTNTWLKESEATKRKKIEAQAKATGDSQKNAQDAYKFLVDNLIPNAVTLASDDPKIQQTFARYAVNVWSSLPDGLRSNMPADNQLLVNATVDAVRGLTDYNRGVPIDPSGFLGWLNNNFAFNFARDIGRGADIDTKTLNGLSVIALGMSGLNPRLFADQVISPLAAAGGKVKQSEMALVSRAIIGYTKENGQPPDDTEIAKIVNSIVKARAK